jgi:hypothetical protein
MCNCGKKTIHNSPAYNTSQVSQQQQLKTVQQGVRFQYIGATALTAVGSVTGIRYRFNHANDIQIIDKQDVTAMRQVAVLKQL